MRLVIDTNVIISAMLKEESLPWEVFHFAIKHENGLCYNDAILSEYITVINYSKFNFDYKHKKQIIDSITKYGKCYHEINKTSNRRFDDPTDAVFYELAKYLGCYLITGNKKHYPKDPMILTPREFLDKLRILS